MLGISLTERREAQAAADASALAGARALLGGESTASVISTAKSYAKSNGLPAVEADDQTVIAVAVDGDQWDGSVEVDVTKQVRRFFLGALYTGPWQVSAHATAETTDKSVNYILIALDRRDSMSMDEDNREQRQHYFEQYRIKR
ncbi:MAG: hypothetical protein R2849_12950 [Thermomicrobiales bacterium]